MEENKTFLTLVRTNQTLHLDRHHQSCCATVRIATKFNITKKNVNVMVWNDMATILCYKINYKKIVAESLSGRGGLATLSFKKMLV
jgi:hypothetical protein